MRIQSYYDYLTKARRDLWAYLESLPDEVLSKTVIPGERFHSMKDLVLHIATVEDSWLHEDILRDSPVWERASGFPAAFEVRYHDSQPLAWMLEYWRAVEQSTLSYLERLDAPELERVVDAERGWTVEGLLWHVMQHETRHTAQIALLGRQASFKPPFLDLLNYLKR